MRNPLPLLTSALLLILSSLTLTAQSALKPDHQLTNEINLARARLNAQQPGLASAELNRLSETLGRSNRLANLIVDAYAQNDFSTAAALLKEFPGSIDDLRQNGQPLVYRSVEENKPAKLAFLLFHKANPDTVTPYFSEPPLIQAIQYRRWDLATKLIEAGASLTRTNREGRSAPAMVFENWFPGSFGEYTFTNFVPFMLEHGFDPFAASRIRQPQTSILEECLAREDSNNGRWGWGWSGPGSVPMSSMILYGELLLTNKPSPARRTPNGDTALHVAVYWQRTNAIDFLLNAGFNIDQTNNAGLTPLQSLFSASSPVGFGNFYMLLNGQGTPQTTMANYLLAKGATLDIFSAAALGRTNELVSLLGSNPMLVNESDSYGRTPLHYAATAGQPFGAPYGRVNSLRRPIVVRSGASDPPPDVVLLLLNAGANPSSATTKPIPQYVNFPFLPAGTTTLHLAARNGNTAVIRALLAGHADVKLVDENGDTALHVAARSWTTNALPLLISARAPLEATNRAGHTPLRAAVEAGCYADVEVLIQAGASLTNGLGRNSLLHIAAARGDILTAAILLKHGAALDARDAEGRTPFQRAVAAKQWDCLVLLKNSGANINAIDNVGNTALHLLSQQQDDSVYHTPEESTVMEWERKQLSGAGWTGRALRFLVSSKVITPPPPQTWTNTSLSVWLAEHGAKVRATNAAGQTPLHILCASDWGRWIDSNQGSNRVTALLDAGANLEVRDTNGLTPLQIAAASESTQLLKILLSKAGARVDLPDAQGRTLLHHAVENSHDNFERVTTLLAAGANPNAADKQGLTPLHLAVRLRNDGYDYIRRGLVFTLLTNKANPNLADKEGRTPLHLVFQNSGGNFNGYATGLAPLLLTNGANPNLIDKAGRTPLHVLMSSTNPSFHPFAEMGDSRWNFTARNPAGQTPIHLWAARNDPYGNDWDEFRRVVTNATLANLTNYAGDTPLHLAIRANKEQLARLMMQVGADPTLKNLHGETALRLAVERCPAYFDQEVHPPGTRYRFFDSLRLRDEKDVNLWLAADPGLVSLTNRDGVTPLLAATDSGNTNIIARLLELGAPLDPLSALRLGRLEDFRKLLRDVRRPVPGEWLFDAVRFKQLEALQDLVAAGADLQFADADGHSLLFRAKESKNSAMTDWLSAQGCRETFFDALVKGDREQVGAFISTNAPCVDAANRNGLTALYRATAAGRTEIVALLLERGAKVDAPVPGGWTPLHVAAAKDAADIGRLLLKAGASPNAVAQGNLGPLHLAAALGCTNIMEVLLQNDADINLIPPGQGGYSRNSPLHWAAHLGRLDAFKLLLAHGADLNALNQQNQTPLDFARATARGQHWGFPQPPESKFKYDQTMFQPRTRDPMIKELEAAATADAKR